LIEKYKINHSRLIIVIMASKNNVTARIQIKNYNFSKLV
jgi:hypothetical protein